MNQEDFISVALGQYMLTELWSQLDWRDEKDDSPEPFDAWATVDDLTKAAQDAMAADVRDFIVANWAVVRELDPEQVGHDFALTRNRHGTGFWDRGLGELGSRLTEVAQVYGETNYYRLTTDNGDMVDVD